MSDFRVACWVAVLASGAWAGDAVAAPTAASASCVKAIGKARAQRLVKQCFMVSTATRPLCESGDFECAPLLEYTQQMCGKLGSSAPAFCQEQAIAAELSESALLERFLATIQAEQADSLQARARIQALRAKIEPLATQRKAASAALKSGQESFAKGLSAARSARAKFEAAVKKPGAVGLDAAREAVYAQFDSASKHGESLAKEAAAVQALEQELSTLVSDAGSARLTISLAALDSKDAKSLTESLSAQLAKSATKLQVEATAKQKLAAKDRSRGPQREAAAAKSRSEAAASEVAKARATSAQAAEASKALQALDGESAREMRALSSMAGATAASRAAQDLSFLAAQKAAKAQVQAGVARDEVERLVRVAATRRRADAPSAKANRCDLEKVDFRNFDFPSPYNPKDPAERYRNGKAAGPEWKDAEFNVPSISSAKFFDLDGNGKKEAVVFIEKSVSPHSGPDNELRFMELDEQCRIQQLAVIGGGVFEGAMKGKSYFYSDTILETPEGMSGNFASGTERVEVRYINGMMQELGRKPERN